MPKVTAEYRDARRTHVLDAARRCFVRDGFHATSIADVCREAGVSPGVVYLYFASKDEIVAAIAAQNLDGITQAARRIAEEHGDRGAGALLSELLAYIRAEHKSRDTAALALLVWSESLRNAAIAEQLNAAFSETHRIFADVLRATTDTPDAEVEATSSTFACIYVGYVMQLATQSPTAVAAVPGLVETLWPAPAP